MEGAADAHGLEELSERLENHLRLAPEEREAGAEPLFRDLAGFTAGALWRRGTRNDDHSRPA